MRFEWDERKNKANVTKHGISFERAATIFAGEVLSFHNALYDYGEARTINIGETDDTLIVTVVSTDRNGNTRLISARKANKKDRRLYNDHKEKT